MEKAFHENTDAPKTCPIRKFPSDATSSAALQTREIGAKACKKAWTHAQTRTPWRDRYQRRRLTSADIRG